MFTKLRAVHIAVKDLEEATKEYGERFGLKASQSGPQPQTGIKNAVFPLGDTIVELIEPLEAGQGPVAKFLDTRGEGIYMFALEVDDIDSAVKELQAKGVRLLNADPESRAKGAPLFIHPQSTHGALISLNEKPKT